jgi:hypothetical protein
MTGLHALECVPEGERAGEARHRKARGGPHVRTDVLRDGRTEDPTLAGGSGNGAETDVDGLVCPALALLAPAKAVTVRYAGSVCQPAPARMASMASW